MIEQLSKRRMRLASGTKRKWAAVVGGKSDRLIHSASAEAAAPTGRSFAFQFAIMSQTPKKTV